jgi:hypothetical protein
VATILLYSREGTTLEMGQNQPFGRRIFGNPEFAIWTTGLDTHADEIHALVLDGFQRFALQQNGES